MFGVKSGQYRNRLRAFAVPLSIGAAVLLLPVVASACPSCSGALASSQGMDDPNRNLTSGIYVSLLFMLSMPFLLVSCYGAYFYSLYRMKVRREQESLVAAGLEVEGNLSPSPA